MTVHVRSNMPNSPRMLSLVRAPIRNLDGAGPARRARPSQAAQMIGTGLTRVGNDDVTNAEVVFRHKVVGDRNPASSSKTTMMTASLVVRNDVKHGRCAMSVSFRSPVPTGKGASPHAPSYVRSSYQGVPVHCILEQRRIEIADRLLLLGGILRATAFWSAAGLSLR